MLMRSFFILYFCLISIVRAITLPWLCGLKCNDTDIYYEMIEYMMEKINNISNRCYSTQHYKKNVDLLILDFDTVYFIYEQTENNGLMLAVKGKGRNKKQQLTTYYLEQTKNRHKDKKIYVSYCLLDRNLQTKNLTNLQFSNLAHKIIVYDGSCVKKVKNNKITLQIRNPAHCNCINLQTIDDMKEQVTKNCMRKYQMDKLTCNRVFYEENYDGIENQLRSFVKNWAEHRFFFLFIRSLMQDPTFGPYFVFFLETSSKIGGKSRVNGSDEFINLFRTKNIDSIPKDMRKQWLEFVHFVLVDLFFFMANEQRFEKMEYYSCIKHKYDLYSLMCSIEKKLKSTISTHCDAIQTIWDWSRKSKTNNLYCSTDKFEIINAYNKSIPRLYTLASRKACGTFEIKMDQFDF